ncbi:MAG TPA: DUF748 domain-containing protein [Candidatus Paceibacterota bacterium]|nr:DUF748 domain-containing protein [Verrucomicrobiota bacterium]HSA10301.1 DUF748 domain-containing protein [Candidatus Paceibacterota bacterium]
MRIQIPSLQGLKQSRWYKRLLWAGAVLLLYVLVGFFVLPPIIKSQLVKRLPPITKRQVAVRQVKFNPLALSLTIRGLSLTEPNGAVFASWEELYVNLQLSSLVRFAWTFAEIGLKQPYGHIALSKDGQFNFANMAEKTEPPPPKPEKPGALPRINVRRLHIDDGVVVFDDGTHRLPLHTEFKPINISLTNLTTRLGKDSVYSFEARSDSGRSFAWTGSLTVQPFESRGRFEMVGADLSKWTPVARDFVKAEITGGRLSVRADYALAAGTNGFDASLTNCAAELAAFKVKDLNTGETVTSVPWFALREVDFDLRRREVRIGNVRLVRYDQIVRVEKDGALNLARLLDPRPAQPAPTNTAPEASAAPWVIAVNDVTVKDAAVSFADLSRSNRFETTLKPIQVHLQRFATRSDSDAAWDFSMATEVGETITGSGTLALAPLRSAGEVKLSGIQIRKYAPYYQDSLRGEVLAGKVDVGVGYRFAAASNAPLVTVSNAGVTLTGFQLKAADTGETVVSIPSFSIQGTEASLAERRIQVGMVKSTGGSILARQSKDGKINLLGLLNPPAPKPVETNAPAPNAAPWTALLKEIAFDGYAIKLEDQKPAKPAALALDQLTFNVQGLSTVSNEPIKVSLSARLNQAGTLAAQGTAKITPPAADMAIRLNDLDLRPFQPYVNEAVRLGIASGKFSTQGRVLYTPPGAGAPMLKFTGGLSLTNFVTTDQVLFKEFVKWDALDVTGIDFDLQPNQLQVQEVKWRGLEGSILIGPDQRPNLKTILPEKPAGAPAAPATNAPPAKAGEFPMQLGALVLENAAFHFADESIQPHCTFDVQELSGTVKGLSSQEQSTAMVDLGGKVEATSPFSILGKVNPLARDPQLALAVAFTNMDLTALSTYLEKFAGHPLNKGKLFMDLHYDISQRQLKAENKFRIDHFTLGPRNESTNATSLPVKLAVALLKDRNGQINLDIPLSGRTDDPQFKIAPIVAKVVVNLIMKAATSPFSLLGGLVGGGEELSFVEFQPGLAEIPDAEAQKLDKLVQALYERPAVNLEIAGSFDLERDHPALARMKLEQHLKVLHLKELADAGKTVPSPSGIQLEPAARERLLKQVYLELGTNQTLVLPPVAGATDTNAVSAPPVTSLPDPKELQAVAKASDKAPAAKPAKRKGIAGLIGFGARSSSPSKQPSSAQLPATPAGTPLTTDQLEAKLASVVQVSGNEQGALMKQRAQAVQALILQGGKVTAERLFIVTPKTTTGAAKGQSRVNLSLQ